jgi:hypothetical protein
MTEKFYVTEMAYLCKLLGTSQELQLEKVENYWPLLKHMSEHDFHMAIVGIIREYTSTDSKKFPMVAHFLKYSSNNTQGMATKALSTLKVYVRKAGRYESVNFNDNALHSTILAFGGWPAICAMTDKDWSIQEGRIAETYKTFVQSGSFEKVHHVPGISEKEAGFFRIYQVDAQTGTALGYCRCRGPMILQSVDNKLLSAHSTKDQDSNIHISGAGHPEAMGKMHEAQEVA